jgi:hypothetical protein
VLDDQAGHQVKGIVVKPGRRRGDIVRLEDDYGRVPS